MVRLTTNLFSPFQVPSPAPHFAYPHRRGRWPRHPLQLGSHQEERAGAKGKPYQLLCLRRPEWRWDLRSRRSGRARLLCRGTYRPRELVISGAIPRLSRVRRPFMSRDGIDDRSIKKGGLPLNRESTIRKPIQAVVKWHHVPRLHVYKAKGVLGRRSVSLCYMI